MLSKGDIQIIESLLDKHLDTKLDSKLRPIHEEQSEFKNETRRQFQNTRSDIRRVHRDIKLVSSFFDNEYLRLQDRVERIEKHLRLNPDS